METKKRIIKFEKKLVRVEDGFRIVSLALIFIMMGLGLIDVLGRYFFNSPISGAKEFCVSALPIIAACALARTQYDRGHVGVELLYEKFPIKMKRVVDICTRFIALFIWALICYQTLIIGNQFLATGRYVEIIHLPRAYLQYAVFVGCILMCIELIHEIFKLLIRADNKEVAA